MKRTRIVRIACRRSSRMTAALTVFAVRTEFFVHIGQLRIVIYAVVFQRGEQVDGVGSFNLTRTRTAENPVGNRPAEYVDLRSFRFLQRQKRIVFDHNDSFVLNLLRKFCAFCARRRIGSAFFVSYNELIKFFREYSDCNAEH